MEGDSTELSEYELELMGSPHRLPHDEERVMRACLYCGIDFKAKGRFNRICTGCKYRRRNDELENG